MMTLLIDVLGWSGAGALLIAYALVSLKKLAGDSTAFQLLNVVGSLLLIINTSYHGAYPSAVVNGVWIVIGIVALFHARRSLQRA